MAQDTNPPPLQGPTAKEKKYDRQLRLWAAAGQQALEEAHVLLLNNGSGAVGVEALKNLVLPGIGTFTIVDEQNVEVEDLGINFFLEESSLQKSRAAECCKFLTELNPEVKGLWEQKETEDFLQNLDTTKYTLILLISPTRLSKVVRRVSDLAWKSSIPFFYIHSTGFYSDFSIQLPPSFPIVDTHPDPASSQDLRLLRPWPELLNHMKETTEGIESFSDHEHGHVPYLLILLHYLGIWEEEHGQYPQNYKEKTAFRDFLGSKVRRNNAEGGEENFEEAVAAVLKSLNAPSIPSGLREVFAEDECDNPRQSSSNFWVIARAIKSFVEEHSILPLPGSVPDMKAQSKDYIALQNIYRAKAHADLLDVTSKVHKLETKLQRQSPTPAKEIEIFCKNAAFVKLIHGNKLALPTTEKPYLTTPRLKQLSMALSDPTSLLPIHLCLLALDLFTDEHHPRNSHAPSLLNTTDATSYQDGSAPWLRAVTGSIQGVSGDSEVDMEEIYGRLSQVAKEIQRSGPVELHNISSLTGGMVAQEVIKVITRQYVPVDNTCVFDGIKSKSEVFKL